MKRTAFKSKAPPRRAETQCSYVPRPRAVAVAMVDTRDKMVVPVPKLMPLRDEEYRRLVASLKCVMCGVVGFSNACHSDNSSKGAGLKSGDETCYPACVSRPGILGCHERIGTVREIPKNQRHELEELWANQTRMTLRKLAMFDAGARRVVERAIGL